MAVMASLLLSSMDIGMVGEFEDSTVIVTFCSDLDVSEI